MNPNKDKFLAIPATSLKLKKSTPDTELANPESKFQVSILASLTLVSGYDGYVPGIKSENVFGQTYGKTSYASSAGTFHRGIDEPSKLKYNTIMKQEFIDHATQQHDTTATIVGVHREEDSYQKVKYPHFL